MFRASLRRLAARLADEVDHLLAADFDFDDEGPHGLELVAGGVDETLRYHREHPHRVPLPRRRDRRPGRVPAAPAHCITPVRPTGSNRSSRLVG